MSKHGKGGTSGLPPPVALTIFSMVYWVMETEIDRRCLPYVRHTVAQEGLLLKYHSPFMGMFTLRYIDKINRKKPLSIRIIRIYVRKSDQHISTLQKLSTLQRTK